MDSTRLVQIRKDFYLAVRSQVESILGRESSELSKYRRTYETELKSLDYALVRKKHFKQAIRKSDIILVGDFHAVKQSSRSLLRLLRGMNQPVILCIECVQSKDQAALDLYITGKISEKDFLTRIQWKKNWSFPWENYRPLFKWAQTNQAKVFAINDSSTRHSLAARDEYSAQLIKNIRGKYPKFQLWIQYGDLHLASKHLPLKLKKLAPQDKISIIYQSPEIIYFKIMDDQLEAATDIVQLSKNQWALNGLSPWVKWQDYQLYLESGFDKKIKRPDNDLTDTVALTVNLLSESFGFNINLSALSVYSSLDSGFLEQLDQLPANIRKRILENIQDSNSMYIPELQIAFVSRLSVNHVSKVAAQYIYFKKNAYLHTLSDPKKDFLKLIWLEMVTYLCSKIANPKRKSDTLQDIRAALQKEQFDDRGKEALMLALNQKLGEMRFVSSGKAKSLMPLQTNKFNQKSYMTASQILGGIMGEKFYFALHQKHLKLPADYKIIFKDLQGTKFTESYYESLELIESWPTTFKSKFDRL